MSSFTTTTRKSTTEINCDINTAYSIDDLFSPSTPTAINYAQQQLLDQNKATSTGVPNFDCLPLQHSNNNNHAGGIVPTLPIESLSINHHNTINQEWMSPMELNYSEYNQPDMNFLFNYNGLVHGRDLPSTSASDSNTALGKDQQQQDLKERGAEQFRRFSMEDSSTFNQQNRLVDYPFQLEQRIVPSTTCMDYYNYYNHQQKERSSMPNVFIMSNNNTAAAASGSQLSWQQTSLLQKKPTTVASDFTTPTIMSSSISSPLGFKTQTNKKRSMIEQVLDEDYCPSIVSSLSEPIPTTSATSHWMASRKRTKSIRSTDHHHSVAAAATNNMDDNKSNSSSISSSSASQLFTGSPTEYTAPVVDTMIHEQFVMSTAISDPTFYDNDDNKHHNSSNNSSSSSSNSNQILAAMPRRQKLRYDGDHYTPKWVRYTGHLKEGYCDSCHQGKWLQLKNSAYWYHKQFYHGISSVSGKSFMKPLEQRMGKGDMIEGLCHQCRRFVPACNGKKKNNYMLWYRHAHKCHLYDKPKATTLSKSIRKLSNDGTAAITKQQ